MKKFLSLLLLIIIYIISEVVILFLFFISKIYLPVISVGLLFISVFLLVTGFIYLILYTKLELPLSHFSFIRFSLILTQALLFLSSIFILFYKTKSPIYLEELSIFSQYKYLLFCILSIIGIILMLISYFFKHDLFFAVTFLNLQEEMRIILYTWNDTIFSVICSKLIDKLYGSKIFLFIYLFTHFSIFYIMRIILLLLFINFIWFNGDLRWILFVVPFSFIIWVLSFFDYYFQIFFKNHCNYLRSILNVKQINTVQAFSGMIYTSLDNLNFNLTSHGYNEGYTLEDMPVLINEWHIAAYLGVYISKYSHFLIIIRRILFILQLINVFALVYFFFVKPYLDTKIAMFTFFRNISFQSSSTILSCQYITEAARIRTKLGRTLLNHETEGVHFGPHLALIDRDDKNPDNPQEIRYHGQPTHGNGTPENPSVPLHPSKDLQGQAKPQNLVPAKRCEYYVESLFDPVEIPGSKQYLASSPACENLAKHKVQEEIT